MRAPGSIVRTSTAVEGKRVSAAAVVLAARYRAGHDVLDRGQVRRRRVVGGGGGLEVPRRRVRRTGRGGRGRRDRDPGRRQRGLQGPGPGPPRRRGDRVGGAASGCSRRTRSARSARSASSTSTAAPPRTPGHACLDWAGSLTGDGYAIQGNILTGEEVVFAMRTAWETSDPEAPLARRLLEALTAGDAAGGDSPRPAVRGAAGGQGGRRVRRPRRHRRRPAGRRPRGRRSPSWPGCSPSASSTSRRRPRRRRCRSPTSSGRSWRRSRRRRAPATSRPGSAPRTTRCGSRPTCPGSTSRSSTSSRGRPDRRDA